MRGEATVQFPPLEIDHDITDWVVAHRVDWLETPFLVITTVGNTLAMTIIAIVAGLIHLRSGRRSQALLVVIGSATGWAAMHGLKFLFARDRPPRGDRLVDIDSYAFPSGHAMMSGIVLGLVAVALWQSHSWIREHRSVLVIAPVLSVIIGLSRVYLGVHWASDVVGGWLFALVWIGLAVAIQSRLTRTAATPAPAGPIGRRDGSRGAERGRSTSRTVRRRDRSDS